MNSDKAGYRQIMKATSIFGGVQVFQIIIQIIKSKAVAVLLGPTGFGIMSLLTTTIGLISSSTNFGLGTSAVKNVSEANASGNLTNVSVILTILRKLVWYTGILGTLITAVLAPWISELTFGNDEYALSFVFLSISLLFTQLSVGQRVALQGMRRITDLAKASAYGSFFGLLITVPVYYFLGNEGIVIGIMVSSVVALLCTWWFARKIPIEVIEVNRKQVFEQGRGMLRMGFLISVSTLLTMLSSYILRIFIHDLDHIGLYAAGFAIINTYVGMVFGAMGTDYYPRLSEVASDNVKSKDVINKQAEISILILGPILLIFIVFVNWIIFILYSSKFDGITTMVQWAALGMFFRAASWAIAFLFLAKGDSKLFFWNELIGNTSMLFLNMLGYHFGGLTGLGVSFLLGYVLYLIQVFYITKYKYAFSFGVGFNKIFIIEVIMGISCFIAISFLNEIYGFLVGSTVILIGCYYSFIKLDERLDIKGDLKRW